MNGDGYVDLAVGVPLEAIGSRQAAGAVVLLKGSAHGLSGTGAQALSQDSAGVPGVAEANDRFGSAVRLLDITGDRRAELAISAPQENGSGAVWSLRGTATNGLTATGSVAVDPTAFGAPTAEALLGARFANATGNAFDYLGEK
ncbi:hypothetical protein [Streptomyces sp. 1222.5]|uniref:hypothetical protein n=1 Tax=Streptomyces sp. 1222.5 TaxID=1881026 RepID=UPI003EBBB6C1